MTDQVFMLLLAGNGTRIYQDIQMKKQFYPLQGKELFIYPLETVLHSDLFSKVVLVIDKDDEAKVKDILQKRVKTSLPILFAYGGKDRNESVYHGLEALKKDAPDVVFIHDAARPLLPLDLLKSMSEGMKEYDAITLALPIHDSVIREEEGQMDYVKRDGLYAVETPQVFAYSEILSIYENGYDPKDTDDFKKALKAGLKVKMMHGSTKLMKVTEIEDLVLVEALLNSMKNHEN